LENRCQILILSYGKTPCSYFRGKVSAQPL
jgi:hypothetical protein